MNYVILGSNGMLGTEFSNLLSEYSAYSRQDADLRNFDRLEKIIKKDKPKVVINCGAYTKVDQAEVDPLKAVDVNSIALYHLGRLAAIYNFRIINFSTDYVFSGDNPSYTDSPKYPLNIYGKSKLAGELLLNSLSPTSTTIRTSWVFSTNGHNFLKTMLNLFQSKNKITVVNDQIGSPTYAYDLAKFVIDNIIELQDFEQYYHITNSGVCSWYDYACYIAEVMQADIEIQPITSNLFQTKAKRPKNSVLINSDFGKSSMRHWKEAVQDCISRI